MRILIRTSTWAIWARRLGGFALPLAIIPVFMHRAMLMTSETFAIIETAAAGIAAVALLAGICACIRLWFTGDRGWGRALGGMFLSLMCLSPWMFAGIQILRYPPVTDVTTDLVDRPVLVSAITARPVDLALLETVDAAFPNARTRRYQLDAQTLFGLVANLVETNGWETVQTRQPLEALSEGQINAMVTTLVGWRDEVAIRIRSDAEGTSVAMRSASLSGLPHDLGANGLRIEEFLVALDNEVTLLMRDAPQPASADEANPDDVSGADAPAPAP
jgi:hypothetical protein